MKCYFCDNVPVGICRWCGRGYCDKHGNRGCHECCGKLDALTAEVLDRKHNPTHMGVLIGIIFWIQVATGSVKLPPPTAGYIIYYIITILLLAFLYKILEPWLIKSKSLLMFGLVVCFYYPIGVILGALFPLVLFWWLLAVGKLMWFMLGGKVEKQNY